MTLNVVRSFDELIEEAKEAEEKDASMSMKLYQRAIKLEPHNELPYNRLMILFRKEKKFKEELDLINNGIKTFQEFYKKRSQKILQGHKTATTLSNALAKSLGQKDKKVQDLYFPEPIPKWIKRREVVEKKLGKK